VLDCFTHGKGAGAEVFLQFHRRLKPAARRRITCVKRPHEPQDVSDALYAVADAAGGGARLIFESLTGMQEIWGGEDPVIRFYSRACPRLYEMNTIAYWLIEKGAHSPRLKSSLNQIAQVAVDLSVKRGRTLMTILKAERQGSAPLNKPLSYWTRGVEVKFESQDRTPVPYELGRIIKELRRQRRISQTQLARLVGVTGSTISQVESNLILPSLPALFRIADILEVDIASLLGEAPRKTRKMVFPRAEAVPAKLAGDAKNVLDALFLTPGKMELAAEAHLVELPAGIRLGRHFSDHKGPELGHVLSGSVRLTVDGDVLTADAGDTICLARETPRLWENPGPGPARLFWVTIR
jgi:transcriptional regulator with XRE-family HTH domain